MNTMKYKINLNNKIYEVVVEDGQAMLIDEYEVKAPKAPAPKAAAPAAAAPAAAAPAAPAAAPVAAADGCKITSITYTGSVIDAYIRDDGYIASVNYTINLSVEGSVTGLGITGSGVMEGVEYETWEILW